MPEEIYGEGVAGGVALVIEKEPIHPWRWLFISIWIIIFTAVVIWILHDQRNTINKIKTAQTALCVMRGDLEQRIHGANEFLRTHPKGIPGIPASLIRDNVVQQQRTLKSLAPLDCPPAESLP